MVRSSPYSDVTNRLPPWPWSTTNLSQVREPKDMFPELAMGFPGSELNICQLRRQMSTSTDCGGSVSVGFGCSSI